MLDTGYWVLGIRYSVSYLV